MQERYINRRKYFSEQATTSREFIVTFVSKTIRLTPETKVLEIGCGEGGFLAPFAEIGCRVTGIDISDGKIKNAKKFFDENSLTGNFITTDFLQQEQPLNEQAKYDVVIAHDVFEHIEQPFKMQFIDHLKLFVRDEGIVFIAFPGWQMPYGGHQQICTHRLAKMPFIHILPEKYYAWLLAKAGEQAATIQGLLSIKRSKVTIESFEKLIKCIFCVKERKMWLINPHYKQKFNLRPMRCVWPFTVIPYFRNYYTTAVWYKLSLPK